MGIQALMTVLESHKDNIPDHVYQELSTKITEMHAKSSSKSIYEITYVCPHFEPCTHGVNQLTCSLRKTIIQLDNTHAIMYMSNINNNGYTHLPVSCMNRSIETSYFVYDTSVEYEEAEADAVGGILPYVQVQLERICVIHMKEI